MVPNGMGETGMGDRATFIATAEYGASVRTLYRLPRPFQDRAPDRHYVMVNVHPCGRRALHVGCNSRDPFEWLACYQPLSERDLAYAEACIAAA